MQSPVQLSDRSECGEDRDDEGAVYATAGLSEHWVVDLVAEVVAALSDPIDGR